MKRILAGAAAAALCLLSPALAGQYRNSDGSVSDGVVMEMGGKPVSPANPLPAASSPSICPDVSGTLTNAGDVVPMTCRNASAYEVVVTPNGATPLTGHLQFLDPVSNVNRAMFKAGVGELDVSAADLAGTPGQQSWRFVSLNGIAVSLSCPNGCSGSASVKIYASFASVGTFVNNPVHTSDEGALRAARAYVASFTAPLNSGNYSSILFANPPGNLYRDIVKVRSVKCGIPTGAVPTLWYGIANPTVNVTGTVGGATWTTAPARNRDNSGPLDTTQVTYLPNSTLYPDQSPSVPLASRISDLIPTGGEPGGPTGTTGPGTSETIVEPGSSLSMTIVGVTYNSGLGNTTVETCGIFILWYREVVN